MTNSRKSNNTKGGTLRDVNATMRASTALQLRAQKLTYEEIAQQCGYSDRSACHRAVQRELDRVVVKNVDELRREELYMLDTMHRECWGLFIDKANKGRLFAADRILAISERRAKLMGLDLDPKNSAMINQVLVREMPQGYGLIEYPVTENK